MPSDRAEVVISGISGVFPESQNVNEFKENLFAKKDLTTLDHRRWNIDLFKGNSQLGKIKDLSKFDHSFFRVHRNHANSITPASRILLEQTYEAIVDAGYNPEELKKTKTGVYIAIGSNDWEDTAAFSQKKINEDFAAGLSRSIIANRISYWLDVYGPSYAIDTACSSGLYAFDRAYQDISNGVCESALVGGFLLCFLSNLSASYGKIGVLSLTGCCRPFDEDADGFVRGEAIVTLFLQKKQNARRIYANVINTFSNCDGYKEGLSVPSGESHIRLYEEVYKGIDVSPKSVSYIEAHGTATRIGDIIEVNAIEEFFCKDRKDVLKIGSVKSNMGHGEACAGLCSLVKMIISFETGLIPPNINLTKLNPKISAFHNGKIEVVTEATPCIGEYFAVNAFGIGGANAHVLISPHNQQKNKKQIENSAIPQLVLLSGRTEEAVDVMTADLENNYSDVEYIHLIRKIFRYTIDGHLYRGYFLKPEGKESIKSSQHIREEKRPLWFVFTGMGCQWPGMGKDLLKIPIFAESIQKSHKLLESKGLDLIKIITEDDPHIFDNVLHTFVGIAAVQVALIDVLNAMEIIPDGIIGHSVGEIGCAYADGSLTAEQTVLGAYYRGITTMTSEFGSGLMAAIGQQYDELVKNLPPEIDIACHNTKNNYTISGPADAVNEYVRSMQSKNIFARAVNTSGIAFHSRYISAAGPKLLSNLKKVITNPQLRSNKWICTSALQSDWDTDKVKYASAEYYTNNLLSPVYFEQAAHNIPENALVIEIAPHGLLQALLKKSLPSSVENTSISSKNHEDNVSFFLSAIGKLYTNGINPKITNLYPPPKFPVSRGTPMIAPLVKWKHDEEWYVPRADENSVKSGERTFVIDVKSEEYEYLMGHVIDGRNIFPGVKYLNIIWESMAIMHGRSLLKTVVVFEDVRFLRATYIMDRDITFHASIQQGTGHFEITEQDAVVIKGRVYLKENTDDDDIDLSSDWNSVPEEELPMKTKDIYKILRLKGFQYKGPFRNVLSANIKGTFGKLGWNNNFVTFTDSLAHLKVMTHDTSELMLPTFMRKTIIDPVKHYEVLDTLDKENPEFPVYHNRNCSAIQSGGIQIHGLKFNAISRKKEIKDVVLEKYQFVPNFINEKSELDTAIRLCANIVIENLQVLKVRSAELLNDQIKPEELISINLLNALKDLPLIQADVSVLIENESDIHLENFNEIKLLKGNLQPTKNLSILIISNILDKKNQLPIFFDALRDNAFIIARERDLDEKSLKNLNLEICFYRNVSSEYIILLRKKQIANLERNPIVFKIDNFSYSWISEIQKSIDEVDVERNQKVVLYAEKDSCNGILGFFNCIRKEYDDDIFRCFFIMDKDAPEFTLDNPFYKTQFLKNLSHNVYKNGKWGSYRHLLIDPLQKRKCLHAFAKIAVRGDLSTLKWVERPIKPINYKNDDPLIHVYYSALNFRDIVLATGKVSVMDIFESRIQEEETLGFEVSGKNEKGERCMAITWANSVSSLVFGDSFMRWKVPDSMTLEEAATIPVTYATAILALLNHGQMRKGQSVLIHAGSGGVGLACIHICIHYECNIFTTVGTPEKVDYIRKTFPQIPKTHIGSSRDTSFEKMVMQQTNGRGVDLLVNSLAEEKFHASLRCVAQRGKFLEIGKYDMSKNTLIDSYNFLKAVSFHSVMFDCFMQAPAEDKLLFRNKMQELIDSGVVKPLKRTVFEPEETEFALRYMAAGKHIGKVLIKIREEESDIKCKPLPLFLDAYPRVMCERNQVYIITGGLGGFGLELADWLILRGARKMILTSRTGIKNGYQLFKIQQWESYGVVVSVDTNDITTEIGVKRLLTFANSLGPVAGIFNLSVLLRDKPFVEQSPDSFVESAGPKAIATIHLDKLSRIMCPDLEHFVVFSSVSCGRGNAAQTNYGMFNSVMERICESRKETNLPALAIQWGAVGDVGLVADMAEENKTVVIGGTLQQKINSCLETLDLFMKQPNPIVASMIVAEKYRPFSNIVNVAANILGIKDLKSISLNWTLPQLGLDSMMATELKQILESEFEIFLTQKDIKNLTFSKLHAMAEDTEQKHSVEIGTLTDEGANELQLIHNFTEEEIKLPIIRIPSLIDNASTGKADVQNIQTIFMFPGQEGYSKIMEVLGNSFAAQLFCLQYISGAPHQDFRCLAQKLLPHITDRLSPNKRFQIMAYSLGCSVAIEAVKLLEQLDYSGKICFIDGAPLYNQSIFAEYYSNPRFTENETEAKVMMTCLKALIPDAIYEELYNDLVSRNSWGSKISLVSSMLSKYVNSTVTMEMILNYIYSLIWLPKLDVKVDQPLKSEAVLIRSSNNTQNIPDDYGLSKYFEAPVQMHRVEADHSNIFKHKKTIEIILNFFF